MLFYLIAGHALADFPLQSSVMATCKDRHANHPVQKSVPWYYWLTMHALIHGLVVAIIITFWTGNKELGVLFGLMETGIHWVIDLLKCEKITNIHIDQALHLLCKLLWFVLITYHVIM